VVLLDIGLPGLNGYEVAKQLRQMKHSQPQCLIAMTGYGSEEDRQRTEEAGFDHHIVKPIEPAELNKLLARSIAAMGG
jgi:CheY-like chemotaxis protein